MLIDIDKIVVGDRIRKDFGDLTDLTESIKKNGLIHPIAINKNYELLAGERRLRVCKSLGWDRIEAHMLDTESEEQDLAIEMDENNTRRNFTGSELAEGIRRQMAIEAAKAKERQGARTDLMETFPEGSSGAARDKAGEAFGISGKQAEKVLYVADNADLLDPADFADWDEGKLSTNKAYQRIRDAKARAERERDAARQELDAAQQDLADAWQAQEDAETEAVMLKRKLESIERPKPEVVEREVVPEDYEATKRKLASLEHENRVYAETDSSLRRQLDSTRKELDKAKEILGMDKTLHDVRRDVQYLITATNSYVRRYGGLTWTVQQLGEVDEPTLDQLRKAVRNLATFSNALMTSLEDANE